MKIIKVTLYLALLLFLPGIVLSGQAKADPQLVQVLMTKSGMITQMEQAPQMVQAGMAQANQQFQKLSQEELDYLSSLVADAYKPAAILDTFRNYLQENLSDGDIRAILAWLDSPLGGKLTGYVTDASTAAAMQEMQAMAETLLKDEGRVSLIKRLDKALGATESGTSLALDTQSAMILAFTASMPIEQRPSMEDITRIVNRGKEQVLPYVEQQTLLSLLYMYRRATNAEIEQYIMFNQSEAATHYNEVETNAMHEAFVKAGRTLARLMAK